MTQALPSGTIGKGEPILFISSQSPKMVRKTGITSCGVNDGSVQCYSDECTCLERGENVVITDTKTSIIV